MRVLLQTALTAWTLCVGGLAIGGVASAAPPTDPELMAAGLAAADPDPVAPAAAPEPPIPSPTVVSFAEWVRASRDNEGLPFVVIDKFEAAVFVFAPDGWLIGAAPALIGFALGDDSTPGVGDRELSNIPPQDRTTPAGRFIAGYRPGGGPEDILWVDYEAAVSLHPLRQVTLVNPRERRLHRLQTPTPLDNRITFGCINVPDAFYDELVRPVFNGTAGVVYVLPEARPVADFFPAFDQVLAAR